MIVIHGMMFIDLDCLDSAVAPAVPKVVVSQPWDLGRAWLVAEEAEPTAPESPDLPAEIEDCEIVAGYQKFQTKEAWN